MRMQLKKVFRRQRRKLRVRKRVFGTVERPRLTVFKSLNHIYAQIIDDQSSKTLCSASSRSKDLRDRIQDGGNVAAAREVGKALASTAQTKGIRAVSLDRNGYRYHGRIKALADAAREAGLAF